MQKGNKYELEADWSTPETDDLALLMFHSVAPHFSFINDLNHLYDFHLSRIEDMELFPDTPAWPLFSSYDPLKQLRCMVAERPAHDSPTAPFWTPGHKLMLLRGPVAAETATAIHLDFASSGPAPDPSDLIATAHRALLDEVRADFTTTTLIPPDCNPPATLKGKALRDYRELYDLIYTIIDYIDIHFIPDN